MTAIANLEAASGTNHVVHAVKNAASKTGADFDYLLQTAVRESSLKPSAKASTSSAAGLFQFIEQTWLGVLKRHGAEFGLEAEAKSIETTSGGRHKVTDPTVREAILALRHDPEVSSLMAGALTKESQQALEAGIGREATAGELYVAHFLGAGGAVKLINAAESDPQARAAVLFPAAADANKSIFYDRSGRAKSVSEVYARLTKETSVPQQALAALETAPRDYTASVSRPSMHKPAPNVIRYSSDPVSGPSPLTLQIAGGPIPPSRPALVLTPAVMDVLSSLDPLPAMTGGNDASDDEKAERDAYRTMPSHAFHDARIDALRGTLA